MVDSKDKGKRWEKDAEKILNKRWPFSWRRIVGSGAFGTQLNIPELRGDLIGKYFFLPFEFRAEAKTGYGGAKQLTVKREWLEKIREESEGTERPEVPCLLCKFSGSRTDTRYFVIFDFDAFHSVLEAFEELYDENIRLREKWEKFSYGEHDDSGVGENS